MITVSRGDKIRGVALSLLSALLLTAVFLFSSLAQRTLAGPPFLFWWFLLPLPALLLLLAAKWLQDKRAGKIRVAGATSGNVQ